MFIHYFRRGLIFIITSAYFQFNLARDVIKMENGKIATNCRSSTIVRCPAIFPNKGSTLCGMDTAMLWGAGCNMWPSISMTAVFKSLLNGEQADAIPVYKTKSILCLCTRVCSLVSRLMPTTLFYKTRLYIVIIHSRTAVFISTFSSLKLELFLKKGGVILSIWQPIGLIILSSPGADSGYALATRGLQQQASHCCS